MTIQITVDCWDVELDNGENLKDLGVDNDLELDRPTAGMSPGTWRLLAYQGDFGDRALLQKLTDHEVVALRRAEAAARIHQ